MKNLGSFWSRPGWHSLPCFTLVPNGMSGNYSLGPILCFCRCVPRPSVCTIDVFNHFRPEGYTLALHSCHRLCGIASTVPGMRKYSTDLVGSQRSLHAVSLLPEIIKICEGNKSQDISLFYLLVLLCGLCIMDLSRISQGGRANNRDEYLFDGSAILSWLS